jgi:hypothetical protein
MPIAVPAREMAAWRADSSTTVSNRARCFIRLSELKGSGGCERYGERSAVEVDPCGEGRMPDDIMEVGPEDVLVDVHVDESVAERGVVIGELDGKADTLVMIAFGTSPRVGADATSWA